MWTWPLPVPHSLESIPAGLCPAGGHCQLSKWICASAGKELTCQCRRCERYRFYHWVEKIPWSRKQQTHSSILAWKIQWTEEPGGLQSMGSQRVRHNWACACACARMHTCTHTHTHTQTHTYTHSSLPASFVVPHCMWDPRSLTRAQICVSCIRRQSLNHSTAREVHDPWMYLANCTNLLTFLTTCEILSFQNKILNEICLISNWLWYFPEGLWKITKSLFLHLVNERCYNN